MCGAAQEITTVLLQCEVFHRKSGARRHASGHRRSFKTKRKVVVPGGGVEPPRAEARRILSPLRLPVPPSRLFVEVPDFSAYFTFYVFFIQDNDCETVQVNVEVFMDFHRSLSFADEVLCGSPSGDGAPPGKP